jgi:hypothetical protein
MKKLFHVLVVFVTLALSVPVGVSTSGCSRKLDPDGVYAGDKTLYNADRTIAEAYDVMHAFVKFEHENRAALASTPEVTKAADHVRMNAQQWLKSSIALRDAYSISPTPETRNNLEDSIRVLRTAIVEASRYMAKGVKQ